MLGKPRILSLLPNSFNKFNKHEHSCKILYILHTIIGSIENQLFVRPLGNDSSLKSLI